MWASVLPWWGIAGVAWIGAILFFCAICRAAGLADQADEAHRGDRARAEVHAPVRFVREPVVLARTRKDKERIR